MISRPAIFTHIIIGLMGIACFGLILFHTSLHPFPENAFDEQAHSSYSTWLSATHHWWPNFNAFPMYSASGAVLTQPNYLNHPPSFYMIGKVLGLQHAADYRTVGLVFATAICAFYYFLAATWFTGVSALVFALLPFALSADYVLGYYSNDGAAILGGFLFCWASYRWLQAPAHVSTLFCMTLGLVLASVKFNAWLLILFYAVFLVKLAWHKILLHPHRKRELLCLFVSMLITSLPFVTFFIREGSPVPNTPGQIAMLREVAQSTGMTALSPVDFFHWLVVALAGFTRLHAGLDVTKIGLFMLLMAWYMLLRNRTPMRSDNEDFYRIGRAACYATFCVLVLHIVFSYERYVSYHWIKDFYIRYYYPLLPAYGIAVALACQHLRKPKAT